MRESCISYAVARTSVCAKERVERECRSGQDENGLSNAYKSKRLCCEESAREECMLMRVGDQKSW